MTVAIGTSVQVVLRKTRGKSDVVAVFNTPEAAQRFMEITALKYPGSYVQEKSTYFKL